MHHFDGMTADLLAFHGGFHNPRGRIRTDDAKSDGAIVGTERIARPVDELSKVEEEGRFNAVLVCWSLRLRHWRQSEKKEQKQGEGSTKTRRQSRENKAAATQTAGRIPRRNKQEMEGDRQFVSLAQKRQVIFA